MVIDKHIHESIIQRKLRGNIQVLFCNSLFPLDNKKLTAEGYYVTPVVQYYTRKRSVYRYFLTGDQSFCDV